MKRQSLKAYNYVEYKTIVRPTIVWKIKHCNNVTVLSVSKIKVLKCTVVIQLLTRTQRKYRIPSV